MGTNSENKKSLTAYNGNVAVTGGSQSNLSAKDLSNLSQLYEIILFGQL